MGDKISQLTSATTLTGTELVPVVQSGTTKKATAADFKTTNAADLVSGTVAAARLPVGSQVNPGILQLGSLSGQACEATDARLSNSRTPSGSAGGDLSGTYPNPSLAASGVVAGTYGTGNVVPQVTVDSKGRVTNVAQATIPIPQAATTNPLPDGVAGPGSSSSYARADHIHQASSTTLTGDVTGTGTGSVPTTLANTGVAQGTYGSSNLVPVVTVDAKGRVLAVSETPFSSSQGGTVTSVDASGGTTGLTVSGGPITDTGTLTLGGTLAIASGGTGATSAAAALTNLGALPAALKGASSGVAELDAGGKVPYAQLPGALGSSPVATLDGNGKVPLAQLYAGTASGLATLDTSGKVPSAQLPSYVDDIIEVPSSSNFPNPGEIGKIYVTLDTNLTYRWTGSTYVQVSSGPLPSSTTPLAAGTADIGVLLTYARADHVHPEQEVPAISSTVPLVASGTGAIGALTTYARADHVHPAQTVSSIDGGTPSAVGGVIQMRRGTSSQWQTANPVLSNGEFGLETDSRALKIGDGTAQWSALSYFPNTYQIQYLIIGGGGSSGSGLSGGGGAGGYRTSVPGETSGGGSSAEPPFQAVAGQSYSVIVGAGGSAGGNIVNFGPGNNGGNSSFAGIQSIGGGGGGWNGLDPQFTFAKGGGSGGGAACYTNLTRTGGTGTSGQGTGGGTSINGASTLGSAGGGGAGAGGAGTNNSDNGGNGGNGLASTITGTSVTRAGGGGGGAGSTSGSIGGTGGTGGGGAGGRPVPPTLSTAGAVNTGGGGGGGSYGDGTSFGAFSAPGPLPGANGGSGIVILRYLGSQRGSGGTVTSSGGYTIHTFTSSGTFTA